MKKDVEMQFLWRPFPETFGASKEILTSVFNGAYAGPAGNEYGF